MIYIPFLYFIRGQRADGHGQDRGRQVGVPFVKDYRDDGRRQPDARRRGEAQQVVAEHVHVRRDRADDSLDERGYNEPKNHPRLKSGRRCCCNNTLQQRRAAHSRNPSAGMGAFHIPRNATTHTLVRFGSLCYSIGLWSGVHTIEIRTSYRAIALRSRDLNMVHITAPLELSKNNTALWLSATMDDLCTLINECQRVARDLDVSSDEE